jgi:tyrosine-protein phosphatase SIW14
VVRHCAGWKIDAIVEEYQGFAEPKIRDCDVKYIKNYQVADLDGLFKEQRRRHDPVLTSYKMLRYMLGTAMMLIFWIFTVVSWKDH